MTPVNVCCPSVFVGMITAECTLNHCVSTKDWPFFRDKLADTHTPSTGNKETCNRPLLVLVRTQACSPVTTHSLRIRGEGCPVHRRTVSTALDFPIRCQQRPSAVMTKIHRKCPMSPTGKNHSQGPNWRTTYPPASHPESQHVQLYNRLFFAILSNSNLKARLSPRNYILPGFRSQMT